MKYYVVSDIHGFYSLLIDSLNEVGYFNDPKPHKLLILGDLFDRGLEAKKLLEFVVKGLENNEIILVKGNHEDLIDEFTTYVYKYVYTKDIRETHHYRNSTVDTVCQLNDIDLETFLTQPKHYCDLVRQSDYFTKVIPACLNYFETEHYIFTHGYLPTMYYMQEDGTYKYYLIENFKECSDKVWQEARWTNGMLAAHSGAEYSKTVVVGHWHSSFGHSKYENKGTEYGETADYSPYYSDHLIAIDGCVPRSFHVNCIIIED